MNIRQTIEMLEKREAEFGSDIDITTLEYAGGDDKPCDVVGFEFDDETQTLRVKTVYR
jgi:hypothetical protein